MINYTIHIYTIKYRVDWKTQLFLVLRPECFHGSPKDDNCWVENDHCVNLMQQIAPDDVELFLTELLAKGPHRTRLWQFGDEYLQWREQCVTLWLG